MKKIIFSLIVISTSVLSCVSHKPVVTAQTKLQTEVKPKKTWQENLKGEKVVLSYDNGKKLVAWSGLQEPRATFGLEWKTSCGSFAVINFFDSTKFFYSIFFQKVGYDTLLQANKFLEIKLPFVDPYNYMIPNDKIILEDADHFRFILRSKKSEDVPVSYDCPTKQWKL